MARTLDGSTASVPEMLEGLLAIAHLSDTHVMDAQSPARVEYLDRYLHPDVALPPAGGDEGRTYRPQELLTTQVLDAMARAINETRRGPLSQRPLDTLLVTGDATDSAQANELDWLCRVLDGGRVQPDSGDLSRYEGVGSPDWPDPAYWHPEGEQADVARTRHGFPLAPGLLDAARRPFDASGVGLPWLAVYGNHDGLVQGTLEVSSATSDHAVGSVKAVTPPPETDPRAARDLLDGILDERTLAIVAGAQTRHVTPDPARAHLTRAEHVAWHLDHGGHGFTRENLERGTAYYRRDLGDVTLLVLDTVNEHGGWQGSIDVDQAQWLRGELDAADDEGRPVLLASHHTAADLVNDQRPEGAARRVLRDEVLDELHRHPCVLAWLDGHTHTTRIIAHPGPSGGFWEITAPSLIDWPQQGRIVELLRTHDGYALACTMLDHAAPARWDPLLPGPGDLAALSRELAANSWAAPPWTQGPDTHPRRGRPEDRNALLLLPRSPGG